MSAPSLSHSDVEDAYARWAPIYDRVFTAVMRPGRRAAAAAVNRIGGRILDVGIGTGLELPMFEEQARITGIDLSAPMLEVARKRVADLGLKNVEDLRVMDAMNLEYADGSFDAVVPSYADAKGARITVPAGTGPRPIATQQQSQSCAYRLVPK